MCVLEELQEAVVAEGKVGMRPQRSPQQPLLGAIKGSVLIWGRFGKICLAVTGGRIGRSQSGFGETLEEAATSWPVPGDLDSGEKGRGPSDV